MYVYIYLFFIFLYLFIYLYLFIFIYLYLFIYIYIFIFIYLYLYIYIYLFIFIYLYLFIYIYIYICIFIYVDIYIYILIFIFIFILYLYLYNYIFIFVYIYIYIYTYIYIYRFYFSTLGAGRSRDSLEILGGQCSALQAFCGCSLGAERYRDSRIMLWGLGTSGIVCDTLGLGTSLCILWAMLGTPGILRVYSRDWVLQGFSENTLGLAHKTTQRSEQGGAASARGGEGHAACKSKPQPASHHEPPRHCFGIRYSLGAGHSTDSLMMGAGALQGFCGDTLYSKDSLLGLGTAGIPRDTLGNAVHSRRSPSIYHLGAGHCHSRGYLATI